MAKNNKHTWLLNVCDTKGNTIDAFTMTGTVKQVNDELFAMAVDDTEKYKEDYKEGAKEIGDCQERIYGVWSNHGKCVRINAYNIFSDYKIIYTAQRLDLVPDRKEQKNAEN